MTTASPQQRAISVPKHYPMGWLVSLLLLANVCGGKAVELGPWDGGLSPNFSASAVASIRRSRAKIVQDSVASLDNDEDLCVDTELKEDSVMEDPAQDRFSLPLEKSSQPEPKTHDTPFRHSRLELALSESPPSHSGNTENSSLSLKKFRSTGTTIVGCIVKDHVILGADTRATDDRMVADKECVKIHRLASNIYCCGAGTSADLDSLTRLAHYSLSLQALQQSSIGNESTQRPLHQEGGILVQPVCVSAACRFLRDALYEAQGSLGVNLILGGHDDTSGAVLTAIHPHGSMDVVPYAALGSGGLAAMAVLEARYQPDLSLEEGIELVKSAVLAGIENDLGSGSQVDLCVLGPGGHVEYTRAMVPSQQLDDNAEKLMLEEETATTSGGVNGFGNLPYAVNSRRVLSSAHDETTRVEKWSTLLGLNNK